MKNFKMNIKKVVINNKVVKLFKKNPKLTWSGTQADLMEIVYVLYYSEMLVDQKGRKLKLIEITNFVFKLFGCKPPKNPSRVLRTIRSRAKPEELSVVYTALCYLYLKNFVVKI